MRWTTSAPVILLCVSLLTPPAPAAEKVGRDHWSFQPIVRPDVPPVKDSRWGHNPIDAFVAAKHAELALTPRPDAAKHVLLRRVYLDLIGLPPTRAELHAFLSDASPDAYEKVVDRLLASPQYGQRWGRHWMDVWRYSDWAGFQAEVRESQPHVWRWRDWVVESLNADKPYDQMVREMLAGDEIAPTDPDVVRATGFLARNWYKFNRNVWLENTVEHTSKAFLGITINCARCHDHLYDPLTQKEHYQFRAFFEPYKVRTDRVPGEPDTAKAGVVRAFDADAGAKTFLFVRGNESQPIETEPLAPAVPEALRGTTGGVNVDAVALPPAAYYPAVQPWLRDEASKAAALAVSKAEGAVAEADRNVSEAQKQLDAAAARAAQPQTETNPSAPSASDTPAPGTIILDDFSSPRPELWKTGEGKWAYRDGMLVQSEPGEAFRRVTSAATHPRDFTVRSRFRITGGNKWCSVGVSFDVNDAGDENAVYLSAHTGGPAAVVQYSEAGKPVYPPDGVTKLPVRLNEVYDLRVDVRGQLLNILVDDVPVKAFVLPKTRPAGGGKLALWCYDATAEFDRVRIDPLPAASKLLDRIEGTPALKAKPATATEAFAAARDALEKAQGAATLARMTLAAARAERVAVEAKLAADAARFATPQAAEYPALAAAAGRAEREAAVWRLEADVLTTERTGNDDAKKGLGETRKKLDAARAKLREPATDYTPLAPAHPTTSTGRRLALAKWITHPGNPLAARVAVNHIWARHFADGLVPTVFDFGGNGKPPTHPALLDWLASELRDNGWRMKHIHRLVVTSATYRMDSSDGAGAERNRSADPDNRYLWRAPVRRMEAELVRDGLLSVGGKLDLTAGGPELDQSAGLTGNRRSLYYRHAHEKQMVLLRLFDAASPNECYRRQHSVVPQQALALANSPLAAAQARLLAAQLAKDDGADFVTAAYEQVLGRAPTAEERGACDAFLKSQAALLAEPAKLQAFQGGEAPSVPPSQDPAQRAREDLVHVLLNHNDFVTIR